MIQSDSETDTGDTQERLSEDESGLVVNLENLLDGVDVRCRPQIQTQVVLLSRPHDLLWGGGGGGIDKKGFVESVCCRCYIVRNEIFRQKSEDICWE